MDVMPHMYISIQYEYGIYSYDYAVDDDDAWMDGWMQQRCSRILLATIHANNDEHFLYYTEVCDGQKIGTIGFKSFKRIHNVYLYYFQ